MTIEKGELATSVEEKKSTNWKMKIIYFDNAGKGKLLHWLLLSVVCWLMLARRLCVYNAGLKVDARWEISTVVMMSYYENVCSCKRHTVVRRVFCFWRFALLFLGLATHYHESWYIRAAVEYGIKAVCLTQLAIKSGNFGSRLVKNRLIVAHIYNDIIQPPLRPLHMCAPW